jgi:hypothetical protein
MRSADAKRSLATLVAGLVVFLTAPAAAQAFALIKWEAGTCKVATCKDSETPGNTSAFYTQAAGHPDFGITDFEFKYTEKGLLKKWKEPEGRVDDVRVDLPPGLAINPEATQTCEPRALEEDKKLCPKGSEVGIDEATGTAEVALGVKETVTEDFPVYNMPRLPGEPSRFGVEIDSATLELLKLQGVVYLEGGISWQKEGPSSETSNVTTGDYHEFFRIPNIPEQPEIIESRLIFWGVPAEHTGVGTPTAFITLPSTCSSKPITHLHVSSHEASKNFIYGKNETPVTATGCGQLAFKPSLSLTAETSQSDQPDGLTADLHVPQPLGEPSKPDSPDVQNAEVALPEGMTLNPSAANGLQACSDTQFEGRACPSASSVGSFSVNAPGIPPGSLSGGVYVGAPEAGKGPETGGEYRIFLIGETPKVPGAEGPGGEYGVGLRLEGRVKANIATGRLTATFANAPQVPFEDLRLHFKGGARAPIANPLACGALAPSGAITPYGGEPAAGAAASGFTVTGCASPLPFALSQSLTPHSPAKAGAYDPATFRLSRGDGQQYLSKISTTLPAGLIGAIPSVPLCGEPAAGKGKCPATSQIGTVAIAAGAGHEPYAFTGRAYLTGPYGGAPYGLSVVVPAVAGPYDLGDVVTRAALSVGLYSARVTVTSTLPTIVGGVPLRLKSLSVAVNRPSFLFNPTDCSALATESLLGSTFGAGQSLSSPFQVKGCGALPFKPSLSVHSGGKTSKAGGASIEVKITQGAHEANLREVQLQLPPQLVARGTTLQKACLQSEFEAGPPPGVCKSTSMVGSATVHTPVLPAALTGKAYLVSHASAAFPDLDLVLEGDGVHFVLVGHTHIGHSGVTTSTFENIPDVPVTSVAVKLPFGSNSALSANGRVCGASLIAPTTIIAQSGAKIARNTKIAVTGCSIELLSHRVRHGRLILTLWVPEKGRVTVSGRGVRGVRARVKKAGRVKLSLALSSRGRAAVHGHGRKLALRIAFVPSAGRNRSALKASLR